MGNSVYLTIRTFLASVHPHVHGELLVVRDGVLLAVGSSPRAWGTHLHHRDRVDSGRFIPTCMGNSVVLSRGSCADPVHPHVHGELPGLSGGRTFPNGSSPRAWGTPRRPGQLPRSDRFIPTCMGNSRGGSANKATGTVHPHVHGELSVLAAEDRDASGSSPRAWGTLHDFGVHQIRMRFIPTCMGNSRGSRAGRGSRPVHPHVHGELPYYLQVDVKSYGSSPRAWGTPGPGPRSRPG